MLCEMKPRSHVVAVVVRILVVKILVVQVVAIVGVIRVIGFCNGFDMARLIVLRMVCLIAGLLGAGAARGIAAGGAGVSLVAPWRRRLAGESLVRFVAAGAFAEHRTDTVEQERAAHHAGGR